MTEQEFKEQYAANSGETAEKLFRPTRLIAMRCYCGQDGCEGWAAVNDTVFARYNHTKLYGSYGVVTQKRKAQ